MATSPPDPDQLPAWAVEAVHLSAYDPGWPGRAAQYAEELRRVLARWLLGPIEHVGSTSIPGIVAKPVVERIGAGHRHRRGSRPGWRDTRLDELEIRSASV